MTIKLEEELISEEGEKLDISKQYVVVRNEGNTTIIKESGRGKRKEYTVKTWKLAKVCESVKSSRGGIRVAGDGKKLGRPQSDKGRKPHSIHCSDEELYLLKYVLHDARNLENMKSDVRYKRKLLDILAEFKQKSTNQG